jgi:hypothetical protein
MNAPQDKPIFTKHGVRADVALPFLAMLLLALVAMAISSCAHTPTRTPEQRAARQGVVLECRVRVRDPHHTDCLVSTKEGPQTFHFRNKR